jgi:SAM-dependent methyltransferase
MTTLEPSPPAAAAPTEFEGKYLDSGGVGGVLINRFFRCVGSLLDGMAVADVLEVGCGAGHSTARLRQMLPASTSLQACDVSPDNVARARQIAPDVPVTVESIYELPRPDKSVDLVVCLEVLEHLDEPARALREVGRVARMGAILSVPREPLWRGLNLLRGAYVGDWGNTPGHVQHWSKRAFIRFVSSQLTVQAARCPLPWTIVWARAHCEREG